MSRSLARVELERLGMVWPEQVAAWADGVEPLRQAFALVFGEHVQLRG
ncbi:hypothetical protein [Streptomyces sp. NPDC002215]